MTLRERYGAFLGIVREIHDLDMADMVLSWDQQTYMPEKGADARASQLATLAGVRHDRLTGDAMAETLAGLDESEGGGLDEDGRVNVREIRRIHERERKIPADLVREIARVQSLAQQAWVKARAEDDWSAFSPWLKKILNLKLQTADAVGWKESRLDALIDEFEPGATAAGIERVFENLKKEYIPFVRRLLDAAAAASPPAESKPFPVSAQEAFCRSLLDLIRFDSKAGRLDVSAHPFTAGNGNDVRLTTRYDERRPEMAIFGVLHEGGHGLYEQGFDPAHEGTPRAQSVSLGIHESQSRTWENMVGRSRPFWDHAFPLLRKAFPEGTAGMSPEEWYRRINRVEASCIRVEADEVTYNLHIILRFELEKAMTEGRAPVDELPRLWNAKMEEYLGITPPDDAHGALQDIHWAMGAIGYFPTYTLGNIYAAQFFRAARRAIPDLEERMAAGDLEPLREWQRREIHGRGQTYSAERLVETVTGEPLDARYLMEYLNGKYGELYGV
ncbi:MAG: carboxypeptidase M32 [Candidatus Eisenbacteria bacterium]|nr:carboxypeptidase M32 [Candidatus Eisenbacteria bacterium]